MTEATYTSGLLFTRAHKLVRERIYRILEEYELTPSYWSVLSIAILASEGVRLATVAREMDVKAPLVTMLANDLIQAGLILRVPHHTDKRAKLLVVTPKGKKLALEIEKKLSDEIGLIMAGVSLEDILAFRRTLSVMTTNAEKANAAQ